MRCLRSSCRLDTRGLPGTRIQSIVGVCSHTGRQAWRPCLLSTAQHSKKNTGGHRSSRPPARHQEPEQRRQRRRRRLPARPRSLTPGKGSAEALRCHCRCHCRSVKPGFRPTSSRSPPAPNAPHATECNLLPGQLSDVTRRNAQGVTGTEKRC